MDAHALEVDVCLDFEAHLKLRLGSRMGSRYRPCDVHAHILRVALANGGKADRHNDRQRNHAYSTTNDGSHDAGSLLCPLFGFHPLLSVCEAQTSVTRITDRRGRSVPV